MERIFYLHSQSKFFNSFYLENILNLSPVIAGMMKWGSWGAKFTLPQYFSMIERCIEYGVTSFDHADIYGHYTVEEEFGKALAMQPSLRDKMQLITKCGIKMLSPNRPQHKIKSYDTSKEHIILSAENSLKNLHTDFIDLLLIHRPDPLMNVTEIAEAFSTLQLQGKVLHFGVSNFTVSQTAMLHNVFPVVANQVEISILKLDAFTGGVLDQCQKEKIIPMAWAPLGGGNIFNSEKESDKRIIAVSQLLAEKYSVFPEQILLAWLLKHPAGIKPVLGTAKQERIKLAMEATKINLSREEWFMLWRASTGNEVA